MATKVGTDTFRVHVNSNHGNPDSTCVYRFRVHGSRIQEPHPA